ncbi:MAG: hypothetical protein HYV26_24235 [Candidatus Hydrogenedentes bacterium]|nr:hypothetical protein [Candidatus Hydrogenedentota bacterium]MBI3118347.1 hypothetical protein [Candidatus Hydrogenedentota bacterium]
MLRGLPAGAESVSFSMWAVQATQEGKTEKSYAAGLEEVKSVLAPLPFDTFEKISIQKGVPAAYEDDTRLKIDSTYALVLHPQAKEDDGRIRLDIRVETRKKPTAPPVNALSATILLKPGEKLKLQGFSLPSGGEMVIVLATST